MRCDELHEIAVMWEYGGQSSDVLLHLEADGDVTVLDLEHAPVPTEIIPNASPDMWGLGAGWEMGMGSLGDFLAGKLPEGRAVDWIADASLEELNAVGQTADRISQAWTTVIAAAR